MSGSSTPKSKSKTQAWSDILPGASVNELARRLNVTKPTLYHYIPSKDDIALELLNLNFEAADNALKAANTRRGTGLDRLRFFAGQYAELMATPIGAAAVQIATLPHSEKVRTHLRELFRMVDVSARQFILEGIEDGSIKECDARWIDFLIFGALHWMTRWFHPENEQSASEVADNLFDIIEFGIAPRNKPADNPNP
jgi:AcrR family transcriptional regulator